MHFLSSKFEKLTKNPLVLEHYNWFFQIPKHEKSLFHYPLSGCFLQMLSVKHKEVVSFGNVCFQQHTKLSLSKQKTSQETNHRQFLLLCLFIYYKADPTWQFWIWFYDIQVKSPRKYYHLYLQHSCAFFQGGLFHYSFPCLTHLYFMPTKHAFPPSSLKIPCINAVSFLFFSWFSLSLLIFPKCMRNATLAAYEMADR